MAYTKLHQSLVTSTIWREPNTTRLVWVTMMAMADKNGEVMASIPGLADLARVTIEECEIALKTFLSPDKYSRTKTMEGRRIQEIEGGWFLINHPQYREMASREDATKKASERMARYRRNKALQSVTVTKNLHIAEADSREQIADTVSPVPTREESGEVEPPRGFPKSEAEAVASAEMAGVPGDFASTEYNRLLGRGFRDAKGVLITNWRGFIKACHSTSISINAEKNGNRKKPEPKQIQEEIQIKILNP